MDFLQVDLKFRALTRQYREQKITLETYREQLKELRVTDGSGQVWMPQELTGRWHVQKGERWVLAWPPGYAPVTHKAKPKKSRGKVFAIFAGLGSLGVIAVCVLTIVAGLLLWFSPDIMDYITQEADNWIDTSESDENLLVEHFLIPGTELEMSYQVSEEGEAVFWLEEWPDFSPLSSKIVAGDQAVMEWDGVQFNGYGELDSTQTQALAEIISSPYGQALPLIALEQACRENSELSAQQLAALLHPWQVHLKYSPVDRTQETLMFLERSGCKDMLDNAENMDRAYLYVNEKNPFPVVFGYFPFDPEGAFEVDENASSSCTPPEQSFEQISLVSFNNKPHFVDIAFNEYGPCGAKCRGACGIDCTLNNCEVEEAVHCSPDEEGNYSGFGVKVNRYICGVHEGCIVHDACYDWCNGFGCGSFWAIWCSHGVLEGNCDGDSIAKYGVSQSMAWARGNGPFEKFWVFDYTLEENYTFEEYLEDCPVEEDLIFGVQPQLVICEGDYTTIFDVKDAENPAYCEFTWSFSLEFWNVGELGGEEFSASTISLESYNFFPWNNCELGNEKTDVYPGVYSGGPNGTFSSQDVDVGVFDLLQVRNGTSVSFDYVADGLSLSGACNIANPEAFDGWTGP